MRTVMKSVLFVIVITVTLEGTVFLNGFPVFAAQGQRFTAKLTGQDEVPPKNTNATGNFEMELSADGTISHYVLNVANIRNITSVQIHAGEKGMHGPLIVTLYTPAKPNVMSNDTHGTLEGKIYSWQFKGPFAGKYISDLMNMINDGKVFINIYTKENPKGEIRGQITRSL